MRRKMRLQNWKQLKSNVAIDCVNAICCVGAYYFCSLSLQIVNIL